jgi:hypothetical protein
MRSTTFFLQLKNRKVVYSLLFLAAFCFSLLAQNLVADKTYASTYSNGHFIDNALLLDANSMGPNDIQSFLDSKSGTLKSTSFLMDCTVAGATANQMYQSIGAPCGQTVSAARIIYYAGQVYGVSPKAILATTQKEQSLVTNPTPTARAYNQAMGFACPDSGACSASSNFFYQIDNGTWALRYHYERANGNNTWWNAKAWVCGTTKNYYSPNLYPKQNVNFYDDNGTLYATVYIENAATSSLYCYTPHAYNNPQAQFGRAAFGSTGMYYSGSYNFVYYYELWFGSTYAFINNGIDYSAVFDPDYYLNAYPDLKSAFGSNQMAAFNHFISWGIKEGRQGNANFNVTSYRNRYPDLRLAFGANLASYYQHYITNGQREGRVATGSVTLTPITSLDGVDYSSIYDYTTYLNNYPDLKQNFSNDDAGALKHFVIYGMGEGRIANNSFDPISYRNRYFDLRHDLGSNLKLYYLHYAQHGQNEGRIATGSYLGGTAVVAGTDYSAVYNFSTYETNYSDIGNTFGLDDTSALQHFVNNGMSEGRQASPDFNVFAYKARYTDLQQAFGNNLKQYYLHYVLYGSKEGRVGN